MNADILISAVLSEGAKRPATFKYDRELSGAVPTDPTAKRRVDNFPKTLDRFAMDHDESDLDTPTPNSGYYRKRYTTRDRILGPKSKSPHREMRIGILLPTLAYRAGMLDANGGIDTSHIPDQHKKEAEAEFDRLISIEANHIHNRARKTSRKLSRFKTYSMGGITGRDMGKRVVDLRSDIKSHDAWDHGYTGVTPSEMGELEAEHFERVHTSDAGERKANTEDGDYLRKMRDIYVLKQGLKNFFQTRSHMLARQDLPHETLMSWSRSMRHKRVRLPSGDDGIDP